MGASTKGTGNQKRAVTAVVEMIDTLKIGSNVVHSILSIFQHDLHDLKVLYIKEEPNPDA
jgi:hypothetical protein